MATLCLVFLSNMKAGHYVIEVQFNNKSFASRQMNLDMLTPEGGKTLHAIVLDEKFHAKVEGEIDKPQLAYLQLHERISVPVVIEPGTISITQEDKFIIVKGTPLNNEYYEYSSKMYEDYMNPESDKNASRGNTLEFCRKHANDPLGALLYLQSDIKLTNDSTLEGQLYEILGDYPKSLKKVRYLHERIEGYNDLREQMMYKDFSFTDALTGKAFKLSDVVGKGRYVFIDFWASWCSACRLELPYVKAANAVAPKDKIEFIGLLVWDKPASAKKAIEQENLPWRQFVDTDGASARTYGVSAIPQTILFAPDGTVLKVGLRGGKLIEYLGSLFK